MTRTRGGNVAILCGPVALAVVALWLARSWDELRGRWYIHELASRDVETRRSAAAELETLDPGLCRETRQQFHLWRSRDGDAEEKLRSLEVLAELGPLPQSAVQRLADDLDLLANEPRRLEAIARLLEKQGSRAACAVPALVRYLVQGQGSSVHRALLAIGEPAALPLARELSHERPTKSLLVTLALGDLGTLARAAVPALVDALKDPIVTDRVREATIKALAAMGPHARPAVPVLVEQLQEATESTRSHAARALTLLGPEAVPAVLPLLSSVDARLRILSARVLCEMGPAAFSDGEALREALTDDEPEVRCCAAAALLQWGERPESALPIVFEALERIPYPARSFVPEILERLGPRKFSMASGLAEVCLGSEDRARLLPVLVKAAENSDAALRALEQGLDEDPFDVRLAAVILKLRRTAQNVDRFLRYLTDSHTAVREAALEIIGDKKLAAPEIARFLLRSINDPAMPQNGVSEALGFVGAPPWPWFSHVSRALAAQGPLALPTAPRLRQFLTGQASRVRLTAAEALSDIDPKPPELFAVALKVLKDRQGWEPERISNTPRDLLITHEMCTSAARLLGKLGSAAREAEGTLRDALHAESVEVRSAAAFALWKTTGDAAAALPVLLEKLERPTAEPFESSEWFPWLLQDARGAECPLAEMGRPAVTSLLPFLEHKLHTVRAAACRELGAFKQEAPAVVPSLCLRLHDSHFLVAEEAVKALVALAPSDVRPMEALLQDADPIVAVRAARVIRDVLVSKAAPLLEPLLQREAVRPGIAFLLSTLEGSPPSIPRQDIPDQRNVSIYEIPTLIADLKGPDAVAREAARALGKLGALARDAVPELIQALQENRIGVEAIRALGRIGCQARLAVPALLRAAESRGTLDSYWESHTAGVHALAAFKDEALPYVLENLATTRPELPSQIVLEVLTRMGPLAAPATPCLIPLLGDENRWQIVPVINAVAAIGPEARAAVPHLQRLIDNPDQRLEVLSAAHRALQRIGP